MSLEQISMREFVAATAGAPRFRATFTPHDARTRSSPGTPRLIGLFHITDGSEAFVLFNRWVGGDEWDPEAEDYTDAVWETVILRSTDTTELVAAGAHTSCRLDWAEGLLVWSDVAVEQFEDGDSPIILAVAGALAYTLCVDAHVYEFLIELKLADSVGQWRLERAPSGPQGFALTRQGPTP